MSAQILQIRDYKPKRKPVEKTLVQMACELMDVVRPTFVDTAPSETNPDKEPA